MNQKKIERVAKVICFTASCKNEEGECIFCNQTDKYKCTLFDSFKDEAEAVIKEISR